MMTINNPLVKKLQYFLTLNKRVEQSWQKMIRKKLRKEKFFGIDMNNNSFEHDNFLVLCQKRMNVHFL